MGDGWTSAELFAQLRAFESALQDAGLRPNTVRTYVGRSETFLRWIIGDYVPRGPNTDGQVGLPIPRPSRGQAALDEMRESLTKEALARYLADYGAVTGYDRSLRELLSNTGNSLDLTDREHRLAVLHWLRTWGCRHLRLSDTERSSDALLAWWRGWGISLPPAGVSLASMSERDVAATSGAYEALATAPAAARAYADREVEVRLGDTAAAKTLFVLRPEVFPPWDEPIRVSVGAAAYRGDSYVGFLGLVATALLGAAQRFGIKVDELPSLLGRPTSSPPKLVDEYLWMRITRRLDSDLPPESEDR